MSLICQLGPGLNEPAAPLDNTLLPSISQIAGVPSLPLPEDVGLVVAVELAGGLDLPAWPRIERAGGTVGQHVAAVHQPDRRRPVGALPEDVGFVVAVEVAGSLGLQLGPGLNEPAALLDNTLLPFINQIAGVPSLPCHRMSDLLSPLKSPVALICQLGPGLNEPAALADTTLVPSMSQIAGVPSVPCRGFGISRRR